MEDKDEGLEYGMSVEEKNEEEGKKLKDIASHSH